MRNTIDNSNFVPYYSVNLTAALESDDLYRAKETISEKSDIADKIVSEIEKIKEFEDTDRKNANSDYAQLRKIHDYFILARLASKGGLENEAVLFLKESKKEYDNAFRQKEYENAFPQKTKEWSNIDQYMDRINKLSVKLDQNMINTPNVHLKSELSEYKKRIEQTETYKNKVDDNKLTPQTYFFY